MLNPVVACARWLSYMRFTLGFIRAAGRIALALVLRQALHGDLFCLNVPRRTSISFEIYEVFKAS
jgi:hypothetical protein